MPLISVCLAVRNGASTIAYAIRSIVLQTVQDWELILVDDGSSDGTLDVVRGFADDRIVILQNSESLGLALSLNKAISRATGKYIARMDADDVCFPDRFEVQSRFLHAHPNIDLIGGQALAFYGNWTVAGKLAAPLAHDAITRSPAASFPIFHPSWMGRAEWFKAHRYNGEFLRAQDFELLLRAARRSSYANVPDIVIGYRYELQNLAKRKLSRKYQRLAFARNRPAFWTDYYKAVGLLHAKDLVDATMSAFGLQRQRRSWEQPDPDLERRWSNLIKALE